MTGLSRDSFRSLLYMRCGMHVDFAGHCRNDATWSFKGSNVPMFCDDCIGNDGDVRVGPQPRVVSPHACEAN